MNVQIRKLARLCGKAAEDSLSWDSSPTVLNWGRFCPPGSIWQCLEFLVFTAGGGGARSWHLVGGGRGYCWATCHAQDVPETQNYPAWSSVVCAGVEKPCSEVYTYAGGRLVLFRLHVGFYLTFRLACPRRLPVILWPSCIPVVCLSACTPWTFQSAA